MTHARPTVVGLARSPKRSVIKFDEVEKFRGTSTPSAQDINVNRLIV